MRKILLAPLLALLFLSCSVKEDRWGCPCTLYLNSLNEIPEGDVLICASQGTDFVSQGLVSREDIVSGTASLTVPRGSCRVTMVAGISGMSSAGDGKLAITPGNPCDPIWAYSELADVEGEVYRHSGTLHKDHAVLTLSVPGLLQGSSLLVTGTVDGYRNTDLMPLNGKFSCEPALSPTVDEYRLCIPRQTDESLTLSVSEKNFDIREIEIGKMLSSIGYDWNAEDLLDIRLTVDLSKSKIDISIADWNPVEFDIVEL